MNLKILFGKTIFSISFYYMHAFCIFRKKKDCNEYSTAIYNVPPKFSEDAIKNLRQSGENLTSIVASRQSDSFSSQSSILNESDVTAKAAIENLLVNFNNNYLYEQMQFYFSYSNLTFEHELENFIRSISFYYMPAFYIFRKKKDCSQYSTAIYNVPPKFSENVIKKLRQPGRNLTSTVSLRQSDSFSSQSSILNESDYITAKAAIKNLLVNFNNNHFCDQSQFYFLHSNLIFKREFENFIRQTIFSISFHYMHAFCIFRKKKDCNEYSTAYNVPSKFFKDSKDSTKSTKILYATSAKLYAVDDNDSSASTIVMSDDVQNIAQEEENEQSFVIDSDISSIGNTVPIIDTQLLRKLA